MVAEEVLEVYYEGLPAEDACDVCVGGTYGFGGIGPVDGEQGLVEAWAWREPG